MFHTVLNMNIDLLHKINLILIFVLPCSSIETRKVRSHCSQILSAVFFCRTETLWEWKAKSVRWHLKQINWSSFDIYCSRGNHRPAFLPKLAPSPSGARATYFALPNSKNQILVASRHLNVLVISPGVTIAIFFWGSVMLSNNWLCFIIILLTLDYVFLSCCILTHDPSNCTQDTT